MIRRRLSLVFMLLAFVPATMQASNASASTSGSATVSVTSGACSGISVSGIGSNTTGIARTDFTLIDTTKDPFHNLVDSKFFYYSPPLPKQVAESWSSTVPLTSGIDYAVAFHVWDRLGDLVAYARKDFYCS